MKDDLINVTGLWMHTASDGTTFLAGNMAGVRVLVFVNKNKKEKKHPDYNLCFDKRQDKAYLPNVSGFLPQTQRFTGDEDEQQ